MSAPGFVYRVVARRNGDDTERGNCGHNHRDSAAATLCRYEPKSFKRDPDMGLYVERQPGGSS